MSKHYKTQIQFVKNQLKENGSISRNLCLSVFISRLGAIISVLKAQNYEFNAYYQPNEHGGRDYIYEQTNRTKQVITRNEDGSVSVSYKRV